MSDGDHQAEALASPLPPRRRRRDARATRERIFKAAEVLFAERGYAGVTIGDIANLAGVNRRMVYVYFGDKDGVYAELMQSAFEEIWRPVVEVLDGIMDREDSLSAYLRVVETYFDALLAHPRYVRILAWEAATGWEVLNRIGSPVLSEVLERDLELIRRGRRDGAIRADIDERMVQIVIGTLPFFYFLILPRQAHLLGDIDMSELHDAARSFIVDAVARVMRGDRAGRGENGAGGPAPR